MVEHHGAYCQNILPGSAVNGKWQQSRAFQEPESSKVVSNQKNRSLGEKHAKLADRA